MICGTWSTEPPPKRAARTGLLARLTGFGKPVPGDVVWGPVRFMDDPTKRKDRPVLVVGRNGNCLLVLMLSSKPREARHTDWYAIGPGPWDRSGRPSRVRLHPYYGLPVREVRRHGGAVDRAVLSSVRAALVHRFGWSL